MNIHTHRTSQSFSRRRFLHGSGGLIASVAASPLIARSARAAGEDGSPRDVLVNIFQRGGCDGLSLCVPYGDPDLYIARPTLAIPPPGGAGTAVDLDGFFGLAPAAAPLLTPWSNGHLAIVHATGSPDPTRSHFDAQTRMEFCNPNQPIGSVSTGWIARHLQSIGPFGTGVLRGVAVANLMPKSLAGAPASVPIPDLANYDFPGNAGTAAARRAAISAMYAGEPPPMGPAAASSLGSIDLLATIDFDNYVPQYGAVYPSTDFGTGLAQAAALIKSGQAVEAIQIDIGHWDTHNQQGPLTGNMADSMDELTRSIEAFYLDLTDYIQTVTLVVMSEFGRRVAQNASLGTDHGHGNCILVMGGHINGGQVITNWPTLAPGALDHGDLAITIDYRDILAEIVQNRLDNPALATVFPGHVPVFQGVTI